MWMLSAGEEVLEMGVSECFDVINVVMKQSSLRLIVCGRRMRKTEH